MRGYSMKTLAERINAGKEELNAIWAKKTALFDEKYALIEAEQAALIETLVSEHGFDKLQEAGLKVSIANAVRIEGVGMHLTIEYHSWRRSDNADKNTFDPKLVDVNLSTTGYGWRMSSNTTPESMTKDFNEYIQAGHDLVLLATWMKTADFTGIAKQLFDISKISQDKYEGYKADEDKEIADNYLARRDEFVEAIFNSISEGDDVSEIVRCRVTNMQSGYGRKYSVSSIPVFDKFTQKGEGFRIIHTFPTEDYIKDSKQTLKSADIKDYISYSITR